MKVNYAIIVIFIASFIAFQIVTADEPECSIRFIYLYNSPYTYEYGYTSSTEYSKYAIERHILHNSEDLKCDFSAITKGNVTDLYDVIEQIHNELQGNEHVFFYLSELSYYYQVESIATKYPNYIFILYGVRLFESLPNVIAYYNANLRELDVFSCYYAIKEKDSLNNRETTSFTIGMIAPLNSNSTIDILQKELEPLKLTTDYIKNEKDVTINIIAVASDGFSSKFNASASTDLLIKKYNVSCIIALQNTAIPYIISAENNVFAIPRSTNARLYIEDVDKRENILAIFQHNHANNFIQIINTKIDDKIDELEGKFFSKSSGYIEGYSSLFNMETKKNIIEALKIISSDCDEEYTPDDNADPLITNFYEYYCSNNEKDYTFTLENRLCESEPKLNDSFHFCELNYDLVLKKLYLEWNDPKVVVLLVLNSLFIVMCILTIIDLIINKNHEEFKRASSLFCRLIIIGLLLMSISIFFWFGMPNKGTCTSRIFFFGIGFSLLYSCYLAKNFRVWRLTQSKENEIDTTLDYHLILKFCLPIIGIELLILILWFSIKTPNILEKQYGDELSLEFLNGCEFNFTFTLILIIYNLLLLIPTIILSYMTRAMSKEYNVTIAVSLYTTILISFLVAISVFVVDYLLNRYIFIAYGIFIVVFVTHIVFFIPKHYRIRLPKKTETNVIELRKAVRNNTDSTSNK